MVTHDRKMRKKTHTKRKFKFKQITIIVKEQVYLRLVAFKSENNFGIQLNLNIFSHSFKYKITS